ncbi:hypothetical protein [Leptolyngbya sp. FACHB-261]|uniref:hypothetical protein n=1 Tax=Leptolyngbya sp. FACHB-261 TaxID=2692806 RepID=UPI001682B4F4|nr:hypothetical protein [Leptolyngbya sp. FACHB-261]MBD2105257.1 hypothetical protein [Leptolyngbya sp. FACHB-261]
MNRLKTGLTLARWVAALPLAAGLLLTGAEVAHSEALTLRPGFSEGTSVSGQSGGAVASSDCGFISRQPNHTLNVAQGSIPYMRVYVESSGDTTLLIEGPDGRYCSDNYNGKNPQLTGPWPVGTYRVYVGDHQGNSSGNPYRLYFTESRQR